MYFVLSLYAYSITYFVIAYTCRSISATANYVVLSRSR